MSIHPVTSDDAKKLQPIVDSVCASLDKIRGIGEQRRHHLRELDIRDTTDRLRVAFAAFLPVDAELPSDAFLADHAERIYNAILGVTRTPVKATR